MYTNDGISIASLLLVPLVSAQYDTPLNTTRETVGWVYAPSYRSTSDIIFSCVLTMGLCVWSALHLNIPSPKDGQVRAWLRNAGWVGLGIFGPELVMFQAFRQWSAAKALQQALLTKRACKTCKEGTVIKLERTCTCTSEGRKDSITDQSSHWTIVHGYYATMGGFVFELSPEDAAVIMNTATPKRELRLAISAQGLLLLAECGLIPEMNTKEIMDKNKSDSLTKAIVLLQAGWMVVQSISRLAYSLPVTLLEVNTIGHVICAMFIYGMWWKKPREIWEPTTISASWVPALCAYMIMSSDLDDTEGWRQWASLKPPLLPEFSNLVFEPDEENADATNPSHTGANGGSSQENLATSSPVGKAHKPGFGSLALQATTDQTSNIKRQKSFQHHLDPKTIEDQTSTARWTLALEAMSRFPHLLCRLTALQTNIRDIAKNNPALYSPQVLLHERASNWPAKGSIPIGPRIQGMIVGATLWFASIAFGAIHVAAWNEYFPSTTEKWLWRTSAVYLAWAGWLWLTICLLGAVSKHFDKHWNKALTGQAHKAVYVLLTPVCALCGALYAFARVYLVIESVVSLRKMPPEMYWTPNWPQVIPHL